MATGGSCRDLRAFQDSKEVEDAFSKLVSGGKSGYKTVITKDKPQPKCDECGKILLGDEKFCPECGRAISRDKN